MPGEAGAHHSDPQWVMDFDVKAPLLYDAPAVAGMATAPVASKADQKWLQKFTDWCTGYHISGTGERGRPINPPSKKVPAEGVNADPRVMIKGR